MKFIKWKKEIKQVHKNHVNNLIIVNDPKASLAKKDIAKSRLKELEKQEMFLESNKFSKTNIQNAASINKNK